MTKKIDCDQVLKNLYSLLDGELDEEIAADLGAHIDHCVNCHGRHDIERKFKQMLRERCKESVAPSTLIDKIRTILRESQG